MIVSLASVVVIVTFNPSAKVRVSVVVSATILSCPETDMVLNENSFVSPLTACQLQVPSPSSLRNLLPPASPVEESSVPSRLQVNVRS